MAVQPVSLGPGSRSASFRFASLGRDDSGLFVGEKLFGAKIASVAYRGLSVDTATLAGA